MQAVTTMSRLTYTPNLSLDRLWAFRRKALSEDGRFDKDQIATLSSDSWDRFSRHIGIWHDNHMVGCIRVTFMSEAKGLPCKIRIKARRDFERVIHPNAAEASRMIVSPQFRHSRTCALLIALAAEQICKQGDQWLIDVVDGPTGLRLRTYYRLGFHDLGVRYFDEVYRSDCVVLAIDGKKHIEVVKNRLWSIAGEAELEPHF